MHCGADSFELASVSNLVRSRIPLQLIGALRLPPDEPHHPHPSLPNRRLDCRSQHAGGTAQRDFSFVCRITNQGIRLQLWMVDAVWRLDGLRVMRKSFDSGNKMRCSCIYQLEAK
jgi:hypothetical protein